MRYVYAVKDENGDLIGLRGARQKDKDGTTLKALVSDAIAYGSRYAINQTAENYGLARQARCNLLRALNILSANIAPPSPRPAGLEILEETMHPQDIIGGGPHAL